MKRLSFCLVITLWMIGSLVGCGGSSSSTATLTPAEVVAADKSALAVGYAAGDSSSSVTQALVLPASGSQGSTITWNSSNAAVISNSGTVSRPLTADTTVTLTATITMAPAIDTKTFPVTVKAQMTDADAVAAPRPPSRSATPAETPRPASRRMSRCRRLAWITARSAGPPATQP